MSVITIPYGFQVASTDPIDSRLVLTKTQMKNLTSTSSDWPLWIQMPQNYLAVCSTDGQLYSFSKDNTPNSETGYFKLAINEASTTNSGLMSAADKTKLNNIQPEATKVSVSDTGDESASQVGWITINGIEKKIIRYDDTALRGSKLDTLPSKVLPSNFNVTTDRIQAKVNMDTTSLDNNATAGTASFNIPAATSKVGTTDSTAGVMSADDKDKLDAIEITNVAIGETESTASRKAKSITLTNKYGVSTEYKIEGSGGGGTYSPFTGATATTDGAEGLVPAPTAGQQEYALEGGGQWKRKRQVYYTTDSSVSPTGAQEGDLWVSSESGSATVLWSDITGDIDSNTALKTRLDQKSTVEIPASASTSNVANYISVKNNDVTTIYKIGGGDPDNSTIEFNASGKLSAKQMSGASSTAPGTAGIVPKPIVGDQTKFLRGDGQWADIGSSIILTNDDDPTKKYILGINNNGLYIKPYVG